MNPKAWIGADPGASGALALYVPTYQFTSGGNAKAAIRAEPAHVDVVDMPMRKDGQLDNWALAERLQYWVDRYEILGVTIERVGAMPGQGVTSMFSFGQSFGALKQAVASAGLHYTLVQPSVWKVIYGLRGGRENKAASAVKALEIFPELKAQLYGPKGGVKDGRAEAVLLAHYGSKLRGKTC